MPKLLTESQADYVGYCYRQYIQQLDITAGFRRQADNHTTACLHRDHCDICDLFGQTVDDQEAILERAAEDLRQAKEGYGG